MSVVRGLAIAACAAAISCGHAAPRAPGPAAEGLWTYAVDATAAPRPRVEATFRGAGDTRLVAGVPIEDVSVVRAGRAESLVPDLGGALVVEECRTECTIAYRVDFAGAPRGLDEVIAVGDGPNATYLSPSYAWMLRPESGRFARIRTRFVGDAATFSTGAAPEMTTREFGEGTFAAFGPQRHAAIDVGGAKVELSILGSATFTLGDAGLTKWVGDAAAAIAGLYGRFPVPRIVVFAVPVDGADEVVFGKVLSLGGPSIAALVGTKLDSSAARDDWVLAHEMVHLGFPTFLGEGRWLGEGIATYYEPILRARAGLRDRRETWRGFARSMSRARAHGVELALEKRGDIDSVYWGGALFALLVDVRVRAATKNARSLDDVMRAVLARGGDATHVWRVRDVIAVGDAATGTRVMSELYERLAVRGEALDPLAELAALGVGDDGALRPAPLDWVREAILPTSHAP